MKKPYTVLVLGLLILCISSCSDDFIELNPITNASEPDFYKTDADFEAAIVSMYGALKEPASNMPFSMEYRADNLTFNSYDYSELAKNILGPNIGNFFWRMYSSLIFPANNIIEKLSAVDGISTSVENTVTGEALFFRGYAYYWMNLGLGRVPKIIQVITSDEANEIGLSSADEIMTQAIEDFTTAASLLPQTASVFGRLDKYDALAFQAKALMQMNNWSEALPLLQDIYNNSGHELEPVWIDMWTSEAEKTSKEFMFQLIYSELDDANSFAQQLLYIEGDNSTQEVYYYKPGLWDSFEAGDIRRDETLGFDSGGIAMNNKYNFGKVNNIWTFDYQILRFTDIQLLYAEALSMVAGSVQQQSLDLMNETRNRAGLIDIIMTDVPDMDAFVEAILAERRAEFVFEGKRYVDLKRHNKLLEKLSDIGLNFGADYLTLPIPQTEKDRVPEGLYD